MKTAYYGTCLDESYHLLAELHKRLSKEIAKIDDRIDLLESVIEDLYSSVDKEESQVLKDRWNALAIKKVLESYRQARQNLCVVIDNLPVHVQ